MPKTTIRERLEEKRMLWPGACSLLTEIEDFSGVCARCGYSYEDHEYLANSVEMEDEDGNRFWALGDSLES